VDPADRAGSAGLLLRPDSPARDAGRDAVAGETRVRMPQAVQAALPHAVPLDPALQVRYPTPSNVVTFHESAIFNRC